MCVTDVIPCFRGSLRFFTNEPGVISFPFITGIDGQVNGAAMSAPRKHKLMKMALDHFVEQGDIISQLHNLDAAGPRVFAMIVNNYLDDVGIIDFPQIVGSNLYDARALQKTGIWSKVADLRFTDQAFPRRLFHIQFGSWIHNWEDHDKFRCLKRPNMIKPWLKDVCARIQRPEFAKCGEGNY